MSDQPAVLRLDSAEPPPCPEHLQGEAERLWHELAPQLAEAGKLTTATARSLEICCVAHAQWRTHTARVEQEGAIVKSPNGFAVVHPAVALANKAADTWRKFSKQLGLDKPPAAGKKPASRFGAFASRVK